MPPRLSVIVPVLNEIESLPLLFEEIGVSLADVTYEIIFVDDGSTDGSAALVERFAKENSSTRAILLARHFGQTAALAAGFKTSQGEIVVALDADGQNDPRDIPRLIEEIDKGYDVVSGWRKLRRDPFSRRWPSAVANRLISLLTGVHLHDFGCTLKAYRRSLLEGLILYGEMHRFLPAWCVWQGARIIELPVNHRPRTKGKSKYGLMRTFKVLLDLLSAKFISGYSTKPSYLFGGIGFLLYMFSAVCIALVFYDKFGPDHFPYLRIPFLLLAFFLGTIGTLLIMLGLLAELIVRLYYESSKQIPYRIRAIIH